MKKKTLVVAVLLLAFLLSSFSQAIPNGIAALGRVRSSAVARMDSGDSVETMDDSVDSGETLWSLDDALSTVDSHQPVNVKLAAASASGTGKEAGALFRAKFEGDRVAGSGEIVDGVYRFTASKTDGEAWHVKLESNYPTVAGRDYRVTYRFRSDVAGKVKFGDFQEFPIKVGMNELTGILIATSGTSYLDLQLGMLSPFTIDFTEIEVKEYADKVEYKDALSSPINFEKESVVYERHDQGYAPIPTRGDGEISLYYFATPWDTGVWKSRLYVKTGLIPEQGVKYRVTADVTGDCDMPFEILFNNGDEEKGYGALYGQKLSAGETTSCEAVISGRGYGDTLILQFSLGETPEEATVTVGNVRVEKVIDAYTTSLSREFALDKTIQTGKILSETVPVSYSPLALNSFSYSGTDTVYEGHDDGYVVSLEESADSAALKITQAPASDRGVWKVKLYAATGVTLEAGTTYRISYDLASVGNQAKYEACFDGDYENAYGALYNRSLTAGGTDHVEQIVTPDVSHGPLTLRLQLGETDGTDGNTVTLRSLKVEKMTPQVQNTSTVSLSAGSAGNVWEEHYDGVAQTVSVSGGAVTLNVSAARTGGGVWSSKLFIKTGVTPEAGEKYRVSAALAATGDTGEFEILYQNPGADLYGGQWGLSGAGTCVSDFTAPASGCGELTLVFQLGNTAASNTVTVSGIEVRKVSGGESAVSMPSFAYPTVTGGSTTNNSFDLGTEGGAAAVLTGNGSSATATVTTPGDDWHIKFYAKPGVTLEAGKSYRISMDVSGAAGCTAFYKNTATGAEDGFGTEPVVNGTVTHVVTPSENGTLEIMLKIGTVAANTAVTVSNVQIEENTESASDVTPGTINYWLEPPGDGAAATQSGNSVTVDTPTPEDDWKIKFYAQPGMALESGKSYRVSFDVTNANGCQACFKDLSSGSETGYGDSWLSSDSQTVTKTIQGSGGVLEILLKLGKLPAGTVVTVGNVHISELTTAYTPKALSGFAYPVTVSESVNKNSFDLEANSGSAATLSGNGSSATATVTTPGDDWNVKLYAKTGVTLEAGKTYRIDMTVTGAGGWNVCYKRVEGSENDFDGSLSFGDTVSNTVTPTESGTLEILLKLGAIAANGSVTVSGVSITELGTETLGDNLMTATLSTGSAGNVNFWAHEDYAAALSVGSSSASMCINTAPDSGREAWKVKLFVHTGLTLEEGKHYRVSADVNADAETDYEICYNNGDTEKGVGALYGLHTGTASQTAVFETTPESAADLVLQFNLGWAASPSAVTVSNVKVEELSLSPDENVLPSFRYNSVGSVSSAADGGYIVSLDKAASSATFQIHQAPAQRHPWNVKLNLKTGFTPAAGKGYRVSFDIEAARAQSLFEVFYDGSTEKTYGELYEQVLPAGKRNVSYIVMPGDSRGELNVQIRLGATNGTEGNTYTISNVKIDDVGFETHQWYEKKNIVELETQYNYTAALTRSRDKAAVKIDRTPTEGREAWKSKLFVYTGVTLRAGQKYRINMDVSSVIPAPFEVCFNNGDEEKGLGAMFGLLATPSGQNVEYVCYPKQDIQLVLQLSLGNCSAPNSIFVSNMKVEKAGAVELVSDTVYNF